MPARSPGQRGCVAAADPPRASSPTRAPLPPDSDQIAFELAGVAAPSPGRLEVVGRWYGVRGRRFMRPTLTLSRGDGRPEVRALADLEGKPWAADEGAVWTAAFQVEMTLEEAATAELSVAPDITVALIDPQGGVIAAGERVAVAGSPSSPLAKSDTARRRPAILGSAAADRVTARLAAAGDALQRERDRRTAAERSLEAERERRAAAERALEEERAQARRQQLELGQLRAELELAGTREAEAGEAATELESTRQQLIAAQRQIEELGRERDRAVRAHAETRTALNERTGALESARQALAAEQAETARLRADVERRPAAAVGSGGRSGAVGGPGSGGSRSGAAGSVGAARSDDPPAAEPDLDGDPEPDGESIGRRMTAVLRGADAPASHASGYGRPAGGHHPAYATARDHSPWFGRLLALVFLIGVIVAIVLVINSTVA